MKGNILLFVDDEYYLLQTLKAIFRRELQEVKQIFAQNAQEALQFLDEQDPDLIGKMVVCSDWLMPGTRGDELLVKIKSRFPQSKNFLLSGMINKEPDPEIFRQAGIVQVIQKPWDNNELKNLIIHAFE